MLKEKECKVDFECVRMKSRIQNDDHSRNDQ